MSRCPPGLKSDTIKFYNEMNAVAKKIAQATSHFFVVTFFLFFWGQGEKNAVANTLRRQVSTFFFYTGPRRQDAAGEQLAIYVFSRYEYSLTKLN
jgi:hypothetical protein